MSEIFQQIHSKVFLQVKTVFESEQVSHSASERLGIRNSKVYPAILVSPSRGVGQNL
jgi:hypothetical protein